MPETALIAVDVQHDFLPGGALGVPGGDAVVEPLVRAARDAGLVVKTRDAHPPTTARSPSRAARGRRTASRARTAPSCTRRSPPSPGPLIDKATTQGADAYSGFDGTGCASCCATPASRTSSSAAWRRTTA